MKYRAQCLDCGALKRSSFSLRCQPCRRAQFIAGVAANKVISTEIRLGRLQRAKTLTCVDCGAPGHDWDHRDYSRPLDVQPVCRSCNIKRGPALRPELVEPTKAAA